jgi:formamidopyrimidine-DNA glycosylase
MPELPDVEVLKEILSRRVVGREIAGARALRPGILKTVVPPLGALVRQEVAAISRRGKLLIFTLRSDLYLVVHLKVAGRFVACRGDTRPTKATGFVLRFADGEDLRLVENGPVKLAAVFVVEDPLHVRAIAEAGVEPLSSEFTLDRLAGLVKGKRRQAKKLLTDQDGIAGIGTAYADEIVFAAGISPIRFVNTLREDEVARLYAAIRDVLAHGVETVRARTRGQLVEGEVRDFMRVYKREGELCFSCGTRIAEIRYAETRTYYCPTCQASGRTLPDRRSWLTR